jgi:hypothetical protein
MKTTVILTTKLSAYRSLLDAAKVIVKDIREFETVSKQDVVRLEKAIATLEAE